MISSKKEVQKTKNKKLLSTQRYLQFANVHHNTLVLKDGSLRAVLEVTAINFDLKSEEEQNAIIVSYQHFLNALNFPIQIVVRSRKLEIESYIRLLKSRKKKVVNDLLKEQMTEHIEYICQLVANTDIMEKKFFLSIPQPVEKAESTSLWKSFLKYISPDDNILSVIKRKQIFNELKSQLDGRVNIVQTGLGNCGLRVQPLKTDEIIRLFYQAYNPDVSRRQKLEIIEDLHISESPEDNLVDDALSDLKGDLRAGIRGLD